MFIFFSIFDIGNYIIKIRKFEDEKFFMILNKVSIFFVIDKIWIGKKIRFIFFYHFRANEQEEIFVDIFCLLLRINVESIFILLIILLSIYKRKDINTSWKKRYQTVKLCYKKKKKISKFIKKSRITFD